MSTPKGSSTVWCCKASPVVQSPLTSIPPDTDPGSRFYDVDGDSFVLRYSEAITLNIQYVRLTPEDDAGPPAS